ncbi:multicopper oxidase [Parathielavia appendiculata]|uniref:Multicopper oxidase n=1 Tax=Parathielavia appendiculata TaxID=2587402 RepID=A0AAN6Z3N9_9PEZI|nr:multicopper oxidase [Parathielavia appendiculata]
MTEARDLTRRAGLLRLAGAESRRVGGGRVHGGRHGDVVVKHSAKSPCENTPTSRHCWGNFSTDTNYYDVTPDTGVTKEFWLSVVEGPCAPDGYQRTCMTFNGTIPGPTIIADWGDEVIIHVTNNMANNGTSIHWHGLRMLNNALNDGVPGVTQCGIAPNENMTYRFRVTQYGSTWYHSHFSLQYAEGLFGGMILRGPTTDDYDEDLGLLFLQDWPHVEAFAGWHQAKFGRPPPVDNGLINGTNTFDCRGLAPTDPKCVGSGKKFEMVFEAGKKYLIRLVNVAIDGVFQFSIDGHTLKVVAHDLVPVVPYTTDSVEITIGQRYDVIVEANAPRGNYWVRPGWLLGCGAINKNTDDITGIVRYDPSSTADPESTSTVTPEKVVPTCLGEPVGKTVPYLALDVTNIGGGVINEILDTTFDSYFKWTINTSSLLLDWADPTMGQIFEGKSLFPTDYNVVGVNASSGTDPEWAVLVIQDMSSLRLAHPIHMHGHDFWVLAEQEGIFDGNTTVFNTVNPSRRDVATLPGNGYLAIAFQFDNPGAWLVHCHIAWHASQGLSLEFVESQAQIEVDSVSRAVFDETCASWKNFKPVWEQDDSGI